MASEPSGDDTDRPEHEYAVVCETCGKDESYGKDFGTASAVCDTHRKTNPSHEVELTRREGATRSNAETDR